MSATGVFYSLFAFLRELFFGKNEDRRKQNVFKKIVLYLVFFGLSSSLWLNKHLIERTFELNSRLGEYKLKVESLKDYRDKNIACEIELNTTKRFAELCTSKQ